VRGGAAQGRREGEGGGTMNHCCNLAVAHCVLRMRPSPIITHTLSLSLTHTHTHTHSLSLYCLLRLNNSMSMFSHDSHQQRRSFGSACHRGYVHWHAVCQLLMTGSAAGRSLCSRFSRRRVHNRIENPCCAMKRSS
jgi:hypothetical protein